MIIAKFKEVCYDLFDILTYAKRKYEKMKKTFEEKMKSKIHQAKKKSSISKFFKLVYYNFLLSFYHIGLGISGNVKRIIIAFATILVFGLSSSFVMMTDPMTDSYAYFVPQNEYREESDLVFAQNEEIDMSQVLDDMDVMDGDEVEQLKDIGESNQFTVDDILNNNEFNEKDRVVASAETYADYEFDKNDWRLLLVNKQHPVPDNYEAELGNINTMKGVMQCDARIIDDLLSMLQAAKEDGVSLWICSPYRDYAYQEMLFDRKINKYMGMGYSYMEAYMLASQVVTVPGASEHQLGLALDIVCNTYTALDAGFGDTEAGKWLYEHSREYGFILRYPKGKEYITGIDFEPWHFRYVGVEAATVIMDEGITLEEFVERLE